MEDDLTWLARNVNEWISSRFTHIARGKLNPALWENLPCADGKSVNLGGLVFYPKSMWIARQGNLKRGVQFEPFVSMEDSASTSGTDALVSELIRRLVEVPEKFSAERLASLSEAVDAELTKRDAVVCGGEGYLNNHWFERGELPPVGAVCEYTLGANAPWFKCEIKYVVRGDGVVMKRIPCGSEQYCSLFSKQPVSFRPLQTERDRDIEEMKQHCPHHGSWDTVGRIYAEAIYDAGYRKQK